MKDAPLFAWATMVEGKPSLIGGFSPNLGAHVSLTAFNQETIEGLRSIALSHGRKMKQPVYLVRFDVLTILESHEDVAP